MAAPIPLLHSGKLHLQLSKIVCPPFFLIIQPNPSLRSILDINVYLLRIHDSLHYLHLISSKSLSKVLGNVSEYTLQHFIAALGTPNYMICQTTDNMLTFSNYELKNVNA